MEYTSQTREILNMQTQTTIRKTKESEKNKVTPVPTRWVGPIEISSVEFKCVQEVPLATYEKPLWAAVSRGARLTRMCGGLSVVVVHECMTRSVLVEADSAVALAEVAHDLPQHKAALMQEVAMTSAFTCLQGWQTQIIGNLLYVRFSFMVGDAAGHNMATKAADVLLDWMLNHYPKLRYVSVSGNFCVDKKVSAVNALLGRGKYVVAEMVVPQAVCARVLRATPAEIVNLHVKKNLLGSIAAGSVHSANAHFANMLLAFYLATGQDAANIVEGSQGIVHAELRQSDLYFSVTLPNVIVGVVGSGKNLSFARENLELLGCLVDGAGQVGGENMRREKDAACGCYGGARKLAALIAASVWCGEISLLAAQANRGELVRSHMKMERNV